MPITAWYVQYSTYQYSTYDHVHVEVENSVLEPPHFNGSATESKSNHLNMLRGAINDESNLYR